MAVDKTTIGTLAVGTLVFILYLTMVQVPDTSQAIYFVNYTSGNDTTYWGLDYILVNVSINTTTILNATSFSINLYNSSYSLVSNSSNSSEVNLFTNFTNLSYGTYYFNATVINGTHNFSTDTYVVTLEEVPLVYVNYSEGNLSCHDTIEVFVNNTETIPNGNTTFYIYDEVNQLIYNETKNDTGVFGFNYTTGFGYYVYNLTIDNGTENYSIPSKIVNFSACNVSFVYNLGYPFRMLCLADGGYYGPDNQNELNSTFTFINNEPYNLTFNMKLKSSLPDYFYLYFTNEYNLGHVDLTTNYSATGIAHLGTGNHSIFIYSTCNTILNRTSMPNLTIKVTRE